MRDDRRSYRPLEQSCRLGPCQELRQMNLGRVTFPPSRSSHARPGNRPHPPVGGKEWRDETPPVGVTAISVEKQEAGRSEENTSELQSLMRHLYADCGLKK